jgi:hypothetical protein
VLINEVMQGVKPTPGAGGATTPPPAAKPSLQQFLEKARAANPGVSDADLTAYYNNTYR